MWHADDPLVYFPERDMNPPDDGPEEDYVDVDICPDCGGELDGTFCPICHCWWDFD